MLSNYLIENINKNPNEVFFNNGELEITFKQFSIYISERSASLQNFGIKKRARVGIYLDKPCDILEIFFSCLLIGSIPIIIPSRMTESELNEITNLIDFSLIISSWEKLKLCRPMNTSSIPIEELSHSSSGCSIKTVANNFTAYETQIILLTSGTTGTPKAVELSANNILSSSKSWNNIINFNKDDYYLCCLPLSHIGGLAIVFRSLIYKFKLLIIQKYNFKKTTHKKLRNINIISVVPSMLNDLLGNDTGINLAAHFKVIIMSGGPASEKLLDKIVHHKLPVYKSYGMTETSSGICGFWINQYPNKKQTVGKIHDNVEIKIDNDLLYIKSPMVMNRYINSHMEHIWFNTNDTAEIDSDGFIKIKTRRKGKIISGGENIDTNEIEKVLLSHPFITSVEVIGKSDYHWGQKIIAYIQSSKKIDEKEILNWVRKFLSVHKIPKEIIFID